MNYIGRFYSVLDCFYTLFYLLFRRFEDEVEGFIEIGAEVSDLALKFVVLATFIGIFDIFGPWGSFILCEDNLFIDVDDEIPPLN